MDRRWWQLPGPSRFLERLERDFRDGRSVVLETPQIIPAGLKEALAERVSLDDLWRWRSVEPCGDGLGEMEDPEESLAWALTGDRRNATSFAARLASDTRWLGLVLWIARRESAATQTWLRFLQEFDRHARNGPVGHPIICLSVTRERATERIEVDAASITVRQWRDVVDLHDTEFFLRERLRSRIRSPLLRELSVAVCAEVAGTDVELAARLSSLTLEGLLTPTEVLVAMAGERGWTPSLASEPCWRMGTLETVEGRDRPHSCTLAVLGHAEELHRRIWRAEVGVLFPFIEEQRVRLLDTLDHLLSVPFYTRFDVILDVRDLEIGHILHQARTRRAAPDIVERLRVLTNMRHSLAHGEPVSIADLASPALQGAY